MTKSQWQIAALLADPARCSATLCQRCLRILADYDLSQPHLLICSALDQRYAWSSGTARRVLDELAGPKLAILIPLKSPHARLQDQILARLAPEYRQLQLCV